MDWRKSSYSQNGGHCVEVAESPVTVSVRDSRHPEHGHLAFPAAEWRAFLASARDEEL